LVYRLNYAKASARLAARSFSAGGQARQPYGFLRMTITTSIVMTSERSEGGYLFNALIYIMFLDSHVSLTASSE
jgi:hypothetical protein